MDDSEKSPEPRMLVVKIPNPEDQLVIFDAYASALGRVAYAWNRLHSDLCDLFVSVVDAKDKRVPDAIWNSTYNDRAQRQMLAAAIQSLPDSHWQKFAPSAKEDIKWILDRANELSNKRDDAIHAPVVLNSGMEGGEMAADAFSGHRRAKNLLGKDLLVEFDWCEQYAQTLCRFTRRIIRRCDGEQIPWPNRPMLPSPREKKEPQDREPPPLSTV